MNNNNYCIIMAGGIGSRFWPLSRTSRPKQFLDILGTGRSLLQQTFDRFQDICPPSNMLIVTSSEYKKQVEEQLPLVPTNNILLEPFRRNTAPCIAYAIFKIQKKNPAANIVVTPADHLIENEQLFKQNIQQGLDFTHHNESLLTLGIKPSRPETGYGYIQLGIPHNPETGIYKVKTFTEKPAYQVAKLFFESGEFFWNSGIFLWSLPVIMRAFEEHLPDIYSLFRRGNDYYHTAGEENFIETVYAECKSISIDYGIMEKSTNVFVMCTDFGWSDLGTWGSLYQHLPRNAEGNAIQGKNVFVYDSNNCIINVSPEKIAVIEGLDDYIVVESDNALLICRKHNEQQIRQFVTDVKMQTGEKYM